MSRHKFWLRYHAFFALLNTVAAMLVPETLVMYVNAWCAIVLVVCATTEWYCVDNGSEV